MVVFAQEGLGFLPVSKNTPLLNFYSMPCKPFVTHQIGTLLWWFLNPGFSRTAVAGI